MDVELWDGQDLFMVYIYKYIYIYILNWDPHPQNGSALVFDVLIYPQVVVRLWCGHKKTRGKVIQTKGSKTFIGSASLYPVGPFAQPQKELNTDAETHSQNKKENSLTFKKT